VTKIKQVSAGKIPEELLSHHVHCRVTSFAFL